MPVHRLLTLSPGRYLTGEDGGILRPDSRVLLEGITKSVGAGEEKTYTETFDNDMANELLDGAVINFEW